MATRRRCLQKIAIGLGIIACRSAVGQPAASACYVAIETAADSLLSGASFFDASGERLATVPLGYRAHGLAEHQSRVVVFPRRPGNRFALIDQATLEIVHTVKSPPGTHFCGHGAFTKNGTDLLITENDYARQRGVIGVYQLDSRVSRVDEIELPLPGPHEIIRAPGQDTFYIAMGGFLTHPDYGRDPLNSHTFKSRVAELTIEPYHQLTDLGEWPDTRGVSLRHLAMDAHARLYVGGQARIDQNPQNRAVLWVYENGFAQLVDCADLLSGYASSVSAEGQTACITSKRSGVILNVDGPLCQSHTVLEVASANSQSRRVKAHSGFELLSINQNSVHVLARHEFDNHGLALPF